MRFFTLITAMTAAAALVAAPALAGERDGRNRDPYAGYRSHNTHHQRSVTQRSVTIQDNRNVVERSITRTSPRVIPNTELRITRTVPQGSAFVRPGEPVRHYRADRLGDVSKPYRTDGYVAQSWAERYRSHHGKNYGKYGKDYNGAHIIRRDGVRHYTYRHRPYILRYDRFNDRWHHGKYKYDYHVRPFPFRSHFDRHHKSTGLKLQLHFGDKDGHGVKLYHQFRRDHFDHDRFRHHGFDRDRFRHHRSFRDHKSFRHHGKDHKGDRFRHHGRRGKHDGHRGKHDGHSKRHGKHDSGVRLHLSF